MSHLTMSPHITTERIIGPPPSDVGDSTIFAAHMFTDNMPAWLSVSLMVFAVTLHVTFYSVIISYCVRCVFNMHKESSLTVLYMFVYIVNLVLGYMLVSQTLEKLYQGNIGPSVAFVSLWIMFPFCAIVFYAVSCRLFVECNVDASKPDPATETESTADMKDFDNLAQREKNVVSEYVSYLTRDALHGGHSEIRNTHNELVREFNRLRGETDDTRNDVVRGVATVEEYAKCVKALETMWDSLKNHYGTH